MSSLYGSIPTSARKTVPTARAHNVLVTRAASWQGAIEVELVHHKEINETSFIVRQTPHGGGHGVDEVIAKGIVGRKADEDPEESN